jgi:predicted RND superfamily exporter protein
MSRHTRPTPEPRRLVAATERALGALAQGAFRRPVTVLLGVAVTVGLALWAAARLRLDADLSRLLPPEAESVVALNALEARTGGLGAVTVALTGPEPALSRAADTVATRLRSVPEIRAVDDRLPVAWFAERALWFAEPAALRTLADALEARTAHEKRARNPLLMDLEETPPPPVETAALEAELRARLGRLGLEPSLGGGPDGAADGRYRSTDGRTLVLFAKPTRRATDLAFARRAVDAVDTATRAALADVPEVAYALSGRYAKRLEQQAALSADLNRASLWAFVGLVAYLAFHFRRVGAVFQVLLPLLVALTWTFGFMAMRFGTLNLLTGMTGAILLGLGIDHGIHLLGRFEAERAAGTDAATAVDRAFGRTGRAALAAALTTVAGFGGLALSSFRGFAEFGVAAGVGSLLVVVSYALVLPAVLAVTGGRRAVRAGRATASPFLASLPRTAPAVVWITLVLVAGTLLTGRTSTFETDFAALEDRGLPAARLDAEVNALLGHSQTPLAALARTAEDEAGVANALRGAALPSVQFVLSLADLLPEGDIARHEARRHAMAALAGAATRVPRGALADDERARLDELRRLTRAPEPTRETLPAEARARFQPLDAPADAPGNVLVFPTVVQSDGAAVSALAQDLRGVLGATDSRPLLAGEALVLADVLTTVEAEAPRVVALTLAIVFAVLWLLLGRIGPAAIALLVAVGTVTVSIGLAALAGQPLNYLNMIMVPVLFGVGVDAAVHLFARLEESPGAPLTILHDTARAVIGALVTTALGFAPLLSAHHPGLASIGWLAVVGLGVNLLLSLVLLPAMIGLRIRLRDRPRRREARVAGLLSTVFGAGFAPVAPGTLGALVALPAAYALSALPVPVRAAALLGAAALGAVAISRYLGADRAADPREVVLDETVGAAIALAFVPFEPPWAVAAFLLFRLFDVVKPWPIGVIDRRVHGGAGVMLDDVAAGLLAGGVLLGLQTHL